jgi:hypothetical protein
MGIRAFSKARALRALCALTALAAASGAYAQNLTVTAANASNDAVYDVTFNNKGGGSISILNNDGSSLHSLQSLTFANNASNQQLDLLVADNQGGEIVRYFGDFPTVPAAGTPVWSFATNGGPSNPDGLSVDAFGNVFVVNVASGTSTQAQVWELVFDSTGHTFQAANRIDTSSSPFTSKTTLAETMVATASMVMACSSPCTSITINPGDLLVLKSDPAGSAVLDYPGQGGQGPSGPTPPTTLINLPTGVQPGGMAFWQTGTGTTLLVTTGTGSILQYSLTTNPATQLQNFNVASLGNGQYKVKTGIQLGVPYVFIADNNNGRIMQFNANGTLRATVTAGVQHPQGIAVTNAGYQPLSNCALNNGCDVLGGAVLTLSATGNNLPGNMLGDVCPVLIDPRATGPGACTNVDLDVSAVCGAAFDNPSGPHIKIPNYMCGASGPSGSGFVLVKTLSAAYSAANLGTFNGQLVEAAANYSNILQGSLPNYTYPVCEPPAGGGSPLAVSAWTSFATEGKEPAESPYMLDATNGCSTGHMGSGGISVWATGLALNQNSVAPPGAIPALVVGQGGQQFLNPAVVDQEYTALLATLSGEENDGLAPPTSPPPGPGPSPPVPNFNFTYTLQQCILTSQAAFDSSNGNANYLGAAAELLTADNNIKTQASNVAIFTGPTTDYPNASGSLRQRAEHLFYDINTRELTNSTGHVPVLPPAAPYLAPKPTIQPQANLSISTGVFFSFTPTASDFAGHNKNLTFSIATLPSWAQFDPYSGTLSGTPPKGSQGRYPISITATDGCALSNPLTFTIKVTG